MGRFLADQPLGSKVKVHTNLSSAELALVAKGLSKLASKGGSRKFVPDNQAERDLLKDLTGSFEEMIDNLSKDVAETLFSGKDL